MIRFALKNMMVRRVRMLLVLLSVVLSAGVALLAYNISQQVNEGIVSTAAYYDILIGPSGSSTQLAMNTMFFTDKPLGTIPYSYVEDLRKSGLVNDVVPFTMGDSYNSARIVGTTPVFLKDKKVADGEMFADVYEAVLGSDVARRYSLSVGDEIITSHGLTGGSGTEHAANPLRVVGILQKTGTAYDNAVFTSYKTVWAIHGNEEHGEEEEDEEEAEAHEGEVCAILVRSKGMNEYYRITSGYADNAQLLVINPSTVLREVLESVDLSSKIVYILCGIILVMNVMVISVITLLNLLDAKKEIALMRLIGIGMGKIQLLYLIQNGILALFSALLALITSHACIALLNGFASSMGIVLDMWTVYPEEAYIALLVMVISILPTAIAISRMAHRDGLEG